MTEEMLSHTVLKEKRLELGLTQKELADLSGIHVEAICAVEKNDFTRYSRPTLLDHQKLVDSTIKDMCSNIGLSTGLIDVSHVSAQMLLEKREELGLGQCAVAQAIDQTHTYISLVEQGKVEGPDSTVERLMAVKRRMAVYYGFVGNDTGRIKGQDEILAEIKILREQLGDMEVRVSKLEPGLDYDSEEYSIASEGYSEDFIGEGAKDSDDSPSETVTTHTPVLAIDGQSLKSTERGGLLPLQYWFLELHSNSILTPEQAEEKGLVLAPTGKIYRINKADGHNPIRFTSEISDVSNSYVAFSIISDVPPGNFLPTLVHQMLDRPIS